MKEIIKKILPTSLKTWIKKTRFSLEMWRRKTRLPKVSLAKGPAHWRNVDIGRQNASGRNLMYGGSNPPPVDQACRIENLNPEQIDYAKFDLLIDASMDVATRRRLIAKDTCASNVVTSNSLRLGGNARLDVRGSALELSAVDRDGQYNYKTVFPRLNLLYNEIPKNISSTIKTTLFSIERQGRINPDFVRRIKHTIWPYEFPDMVVEWDKVFWQSYFRFAFLRNPFERILSGYLNSGWQFCHEGVEFNDFVKTIPNMAEFPDAYDMNTHYKPFGYFVPKIKGKFYLDYIGKCESFAHDMNEILYSSGVDKPQSFPVINRSEHGKYQDYYNSDSRRLVESIYGEEIELGKYVF